jgi:hypothetical protein
VVGVEVGTYVEGTIWLNDARRGESGQFAAGL